MKRSKRLLLLLAALAVVSLGTLGLLHTEEKKEQIKVSGEIILELDSDSVQALSWKNETEALAFHREEGWVYDGDAAFPVSEERMEELLELFRQFGVSFIIESPEDLGQYGLDDPVCTISIGTGEQSWEMKLGDYSAMDSERYISIGDGNVYLAKVDPLDSFDIILKDMIDHDKIPAFDKVERLAFSGGESYTAGYDGESTASLCAEDVYFTRREGEALPLDTSRVNGYLRAIRNLNPTDYVTYNATQEELEACGLDVPELTVTIDYTREEEDGSQVADTFRLAISRDPKELAAAKGTPGQEEDGKREEDSEEAAENITAYARIGDSPILYRISGESYTRLMAAGYDELRHLEVFPGDFADVTGLDISLDGSVYSITSERKEEEHRYYYQGDEVDVSDFQNAMSKLEAEEFTEEAPAGKEEIGLTLYLNKEQHPQVLIELYRYDGSQCLAVVDGEPLALVDRAAVVELVEAVYGIVLG